MITAYFSMAVAVYLMHTVPMDKQHHNWLAVYNELVVYFSCTSLVVFTNYVTNPEVRYDLGYYYLYWICGGLIVVNFVFLTYDLISILVLKVKKRKILKIHKAKLAEKKLKEDQLN